ncbi:MAG TPA: 30S ribosomal protein S12 methylthiotransferase RimO [Clostridiales bacterium]|nr:30S ribosomal protein S12 methylthiotransferase RimO [Clostridiales bacterium]
MTKVGFISLGCSKNLVDTEVMLRTLHDAGYEITPDETEAEIIVVNTCGFIESAKKESIDSILDVAWLKKHGKCKHIIATGCLVERYREEVMREMPEVDALLGVGSIAHITDALRAVEAGEKYTSFEDKESSPLGGERLLTTPEYSAYLKIGEGCDNRCTYCAIPLIRGHFRSRPMDSLIAEAKELETLGVKEINLIAQDSSRYGLDLYGEYKLAALVRRITEETKIPWIRILYCYPDKITDELIEEFRTNDRLVKYMDIPIQHISDTVLARMNRHGRKQLIVDTVNKLRERVPGIVLRTTAMVGFPGETEEEFAELCDYVKAAKFDRFGAFTFSPEEGTVAATMDGQIDEQTKQDRYDTLMQTQLTVTEELNARRIGSTLTVLTEGYDTAAGIHYGRSFADAPDVDGKVYFRSKKRISEGTFVEVKIEEALDYDLVGTLVPEKKETT